MKSAPAPRIVNVGLRGLTLVAKFALVFSLARYLEPVEVGLFGLVFATLRYAVLGIGFDFYQYATRELVIAPRDGRAPLIRNQAVFLALTLALSLPVLYYLFDSGALPWSVAGWFLALLVLELAANELGRTCIAMSAQVSATMVLFFRAGAWVFAVVPLIALDPGMRSLDTVFGAWVVGAAVACTIGAVRVASLAGRGWLGRIDRAWIVRGIRVAAPLLVGTLAIHGLTIFDRYWVESIAGLEVLGAYVLFAGIALAVKAFLDAGVFVFYYPTLIASANDGDVERFRRTLRLMAVQVIGFMAVLVTAALLLVSPLLDWIGRPVYNEYASLFHWLLGATILYALGNVFHYAIYAYRMDKHIVASHAVALASFIAGVHVSYPALGVTAVPACLCLAYAVILVWKALAYKLR